MELTDEQLADIKENYLEKYKPFRHWMDDNSLTFDDIRPRDIMVGLRAKYGVSEVRELMSALRKERVDKQFTMMTSRMCMNPDLTVEQCESVIAQLQDAIVTMQAKKDELQGG